MRNSPSRYPLPYSYHLHAELIRRKLLEWFTTEGRLFPWRDIERGSSHAEGEPIHDPYMILVSEVMLQQTQTSRVVEKLPEFLAKFPTVEALAAASTGDLIRAWQGMGYNRRALRLQQTAAAIVDRFGGVFPRTLEELTRLPGVGRYTASALLCFAFGVDIPAVDVNVVRVYSRLFHKCHTPDQLLPERNVVRIAESIIPAGDGYRWGQALMDFGATICTARRPACGRCPLSHECLSAFPREIELYGSRRHARPEPELRGVPRRVWRGRIIELLRSEPEGVRALEIIDRLLQGGLFPETSVAERAAIVSMLDTLIDEGLIARGGVVREGGVEEGDLIALPF